MFFLSRQDGLSKSEKASVNPASFDDPSASESSQLIDISLNNSSTVPELSRQVRGSMVLAVLKMFGLNPESTVLEVGCNSTGFSPYATQFLEMGKYFGLEVGKSILASEKAQSKATVGRQTKVAWIVEKDYNLRSVENNSVDVACCFSLFPSIPTSAMVQVLTSMHRIVKKGGVFIFTHNLIEDSHNVQQLFLEHSVSTGRMSNTTYPEHAQVASSRIFLGSISELCGWKVEKIIDHDSPIFRIGEQSHAWGESIWVLTKPE